MYALLTFYVPGHTINQSPNHRTHEEHFLEDPIATLLWNNLDTLFKSYKRKNEGPEIPTSFGMNVKPLGSFKLKLIELFDRIISRVQSTRIFNKICELGIVTAITVF